jgi:hypothetical protein
METDVYYYVAKSLADMIHTGFDSEAEMQRLWVESGFTKEFDRTKDARTLIHSLLNRAWEEQGPIVKVNPVQADIDAIANHLFLMLDFNLYTQVYLNLQPIGLLRFDAVPAIERAKAAQAKWADKTLKPYEAKKAIKEPKTAEELEFNQDFILTNLAKKMAALGESTSASFRITPMGSTPALADSRNLSNLPVGADEYIIIPPGWVVFHITWETAPQVMLEENGTFRVCDGDATPQYPFTSSSGGIILNQAIYSRMVMTAVQRGLSLQNTKATPVFVPRLSSLLVATNYATKDAIADIFKDFKVGRDSNITLSIGGRPIITPEIAQPAI